MFYHQGFFVIYILYIYTLIGSVASWLRPLEAARGGRVTSLRYLPRHSVDCPPLPPHTQNGHRVWSAMIYRRPLCPSCADLQVTSDEAYFSKRKGRKNGGRKKCKRICQSRGQATKPLRLPASSSLSCLRLALEESVDLDGSLISTLSTEAQRTVTNTQLLFVYLLHMPECRSLHRLQNNA